MPWLRRPRGRDAEPPEPPPRNCETCGRPIPPERLDALPDATQCLDCKRAERAEAQAPEPVPVPVSPGGETVAPATAPVPEPAPAAPAPPPPSEPAPAVVGPAQAVAAATVEPPPAQPPPAPARAWNIWDLERRARELAGRDVARYEEWQFLLVSLREFANPDGNLPAEFDGLVRESFGELLAPGNGGP
jgi:hypothetical protein